MNNDTPNYTCNSVRHGPYKPSTSMMKVVDIHKTHHNDHGILASIRLTTRSVSVENSASRFQFTTAPSKLRPDSHTIAKKSRLSPTDYQSTGSGETIRRARSCLRIESEKLKNRRGEPKSRELYAQK